MADRIFEPVRSFTKEGISISGSFRPNGSSALVAGQKTGLGFTPSRTGVGVFQILFDDAFASIIHKWAHLALDVADDKIAQITDLDLVAKTMEITIFDISGAAAADVASDPKNVVSFEAFFKNSTVFP